MQRSSRIRGGMEEIYIEEKSRFLFLTFPSSTSSSSCTRFEKRFNEEEIFEISLLASVVSLWNEVLVADIRHICEEVSFSWLIIVCLFHIIFFFFQLTCIKWSRSMHAITNIVMKRIFSSAWERDIVVRANEIAEVRMSMFIAFCLLLKVTSARFPPAHEKHFACVSLFN